MTNNHSGLHHRSIRKFSAAPSLAQQQTLEDVAQATASSNFLQQVTLIKVTDPQKRQRIADLTNCPFVAGEGLLYVFVLDQYRNIETAHLTEEQAAHFTGWAGFFGGVADAELAAQNVLAEAERNGLGGCFLGSVLNDPRQMLALLALPRFTFPVLGLMVGVPAEAPQQKPRLPHAAVVGENAYPAAQDLKDYDTTLNNYYRTRAWNAREETFTDSLLAYTKTDLHHRLEIGQILREQGFHLPQ
ncbi:MULTISPECIES: nitroreductase family protein [unclassified Lacticaseibacillus]|uniref:nitroreductase family protein n=1 Tax=unclassified Lacticaseibacillus TaxID=2759744 RepID=UPI001944A2FC|nr:MULTISPECIES: nitroreductase family protein [unclassified Lacticaseibacillus]